MRQVAKWLFRILAVVVSLLIVAAVVLPLVFKPQLMQLAKTAAKLTLLADATLPYLSLMTDPTTGGVTASYAMLGDINMAEPKALIGFAGPRVIKEAIKKDLPEDFQSSEYLLEHGFLDFIVDRKDLKTRLEELLIIFSKANVA